MPRELVRGVAASRAVGLSPLLALLALAGCVASSPERDGVSAPVAVPDRNQLQAQSLVFYLELLHRFAKAGPAEQSEILANIRRDYEAAPTPSSELRYALAVATPGHPSTDAVMAQRLLRRLLSAPEAMTPVEHAAAFLELQKVDRQLALAAENRRLQTDSDRAERERLAALSRRLAAETEENARLRKALDDAQAKLDAIANIERQTTVRQPTAPEGRP